MTSMATSAKRTPAPAVKKAPAKAPAARAPRVRAPAAPPLVAADAPPTSPPGWYPAPAPGMSEEPYRRYWDGQAWAGVAVPADEVTAPEPAADEVTAPDTDALAIDPITFRGRTMAVNALDAGKLGVWQIIVDEFNAVGDGPPPGASAAMVKAHAEKLGRLLKQGTKVIRSVLADDTDRDWLMDQLMESDLTLQEAAEIVHLAVAAFVAAKQGTAAAPTTGPVGRVRRRR
jgi:hypothetical protein